MTDHKIGTREEWLAARLELLKAEKALTRRNDELAQWRQKLPWVRIDKEYRFETDEGMASLADLFRGRSQLLVYHFMFGPEYTGGCPACSAIADSFNGFAVHLENHDVSMIAVSRAPIAALQAYKRRMGWTFTWASSLDSDFNYDFNTSFTEEQQRSGSVDYNFRGLGTTPGLEAGSEGRQGRPNSFMENIEGITPKVLTERLRELEKLGIVKRRIVSEYPIRVEYGLTDLGREFQPVLLAAASFSMKNMAKIVFKDGKPRTPEDVILE